MAKASLSEASFFRPQGQTSSSGLKTDDGWRECPSVKRRLRDYLRDSAFMLVVALLVSCADTYPESRNHADTVYVQGGSARQPVRESPTIPVRKGVPIAATPPPTRNASAATAPSKSANITVDDRLGARRAQLLKRVEALSHDEADSVCLTMQLVPHEQIFDHSVQPKKILIRYTNQATSGADLDFLERVLNDRR